MNNTDYHIIKRTEIYLLIKNYENLFAISQISLSTNMKAR
jgi:hypothetical protein